MIACLRSARFVLPDNSASVYIELRRLHNITAQSVDNSNRAFLVTKRYSNLPNVMSRKLFEGSGALNEARSYWKHQMMILEDQGLRRCDDRIIGFHEED